MTYELLLVQQAEAEVDQIVHYLAKRSPQGAIAWCNRWQEVLAELRGNPLTHGLAPESKEYSTALRQVLFKTRRGRIYRALFTVVGRGVYIIHVRGPRQDLTRRRRMRAALKRAMT